MWPDAGETQRLLRQVEQADSAAADALWERHRPALRRLIELRLDRALGRRVDASDIVQDVLLRASQRLGDYLRNPVDAVPPLAAADLAQDQMIDAHRRHRKAGKRSLDRERPLAGAAGSGAFADRSSLDLAGQLRDPALTPAAVALRGELSAGSSAALAAARRRRIARSSCSATSSSSPTTRRRWRWD